MTNFLAAYYAELTPEQRNPDSFDPVTNSVRVPVELVGASNDGPTYRYENRLLEPGDGVVHIHPTGQASLYRFTADGNFSETPLSVGDEVTLICSGQDVQTQSGGKLVVCRDGSVVAVGMSLIMAMMPMILQQANPAPVLNYVDDTVGYTSDTYSGVSDDFPVDNSSAEDTPVDAAPAETIAPEDTFVVPPGAPFEP